MSKLVIKFFRRGVLKSPIFHIVVVRNVGQSKKGFFLEKLGYYDPMFFKSGRKVLIINFFKLGVWLNRGALLHKTVRRRIA
jgi:small subunit ribosomal protein S16